MSPPNGKPPALWPPKGYEPRARPRGGPPSLLFEEPETVAAFLLNVSRGVAFERAAQMAGFTPRTAYTMKAEGRKVARAVASEERKAAQEGRRAKRPRVNSPDWVRLQFFQALQTAEAQSIGHLELSVFRDAIKSGKVALAALERLAPERWGRRTPTPPPVAPESIPSLTVERAAAPYEGTGAEAAAARAGEPTGEPAPGTSFDDSGEDDDGEDA